MFASVCARAVATQVRTIIRLRAAVRKGSGGQQSAEFGEGRGVREEPYLSSLGCYVPLALRTDMGAFLEQQYRLVGPFSKTNGAH